MGVSDDDFRPARGDADNMGFQRGDEEPSRATGRVIRAVCVLIFFTTAAVAAGAMSDGPAWLALVSLGTAGLALATSGGLEIREQLSAPLLNTVAHTAGGR
jgi:hypothetical protein